MRLGKYFGPLASVNDVALEESSEKERALCRKKTMKRMKEAYRAAIERVNIALSSPRSKFRKLVGIFKRRSVWRSSPRRKIRLVRNF